MIRRTLLAATLALVAGCGGPRPPDADAAGDTLRAALDAWKGGRPSDSLADDSPAIHAADPRWQSGYRLLNYEVDGNPAPSGHDLRCSVVLSLVNPKGKTVRERAEYTVTTNPARTVVRVAF